MMREIEGVAADEPQLTRRWFHDDYFDLFVWQTEKGNVTQFQLCYGIGASEQALVWRREEGFFHDGVVRGEPADSPIAARFEEAAQSLPREVRTEVSKRVREFAERKLPVESRRKRFRRESWQRAPASAGRRGNGSSRHSKH
jgi:hypothetical protein